MAHMVHFVEEPAANSLVARANLDWQEQGCTVPVASVEVPVASVEVPAASVEVPVASVEVPAVVDRAWIAADNFEDSSDMETVAAPAQNQVLVRKQNLLRLRLNHKMMAQDMVVARALACAKQALALPMNLATVYQKALRRQELQMSCLMERSYR